MAHSFDKVNYTFYSSTLGRSVVPTEADFNALKLTNVQTMKKWLPFLVSEDETDGIDIAVCMMIEVEYNDNQIVKGADDSSIASENIGGHSISFSSTTRTKLEELNAKSTDAKKIEMAKLFCTFDFGVM